MRYSTLPPLNSLDGATDVGGHGAGLGVGHQATRAERAAELTDERHHVGRRDRHVEVHLALLDLRREVVGADDVGTGGTGFLGRLAGGEHGDSDILAGTGRQGDGATDHLVGLAWVDAETEGDVDVLVELGGRHLT